MLHLCGVLLGVERKAFKETSSGEAEKIIRNCNLLGY